MLLTIDVGNTQTVLGLYDPDTETGDGAAVGLVDHWRISTVHERTSDEYSVMVRSMLDTTDVDFDTEITGTAICSGVPRILANLRQMVNRYLPNEPIVIEPGVKTGMPILYDNPKEVGADRIANAGVAIDIFDRPEDAVAGADAVYVDTWTSMGQEAEAEQRRRDFEGFQIDERLMALAAPDAIFLHCLPAHRNEEVTDAVLDGDRSRIWVQAVNRMHAARGALAWLAQENG